MGSAGGESAVSSSLNFDFESKRATRPGFSDVPGFLRGHSGVWYTTDGDPDIVKGKLEALDGLTRVFDRFETKFWLDNFKNLRFSFLCSVVPFSGRRLSFRRWLLSCQERGEMNRAPRQGCVRFLWCTD